jgi:hypothetical protein
MMSVLPVIASDSEAIQSDKQELDCFVARAPRNDEKKKALAHHLEKNFKKKSRALALL